MGGGGWWGSKRWWVGSERLGGLVVRGSEWFDGLVVRDGGLVVRGLVDW